MKIMGRLDFQVRAADLIISYVEGDTSELEEIATELEILFDSSQEIDTESMTLKRLQKSLLLLKKKLLIYQKNSED